MHLPVIEDYSYLRNIRVPDGIFVSSKAGTRIDRFSYYSETNENYDHADDKAPSSSCYSHPMPPYYNHGTSISRPLSSSSSSSSTVLSARTRPPQLSPPPGVSANNQTFSLPRISALTINNNHNDRRPSFPHRHTVQNLPGHAPPPNYAPLSPEDRRVLNSFRIAL